jgi:hypothetical protein
MDCVPAKANNVTWFEGYLSRDEREKLHGHKGAETFAQPIQKRIENDRRADG